MSRVAHTQPDLFAPPPEPPSAEPPPVDPIAGLQAMLDHLRSQSVAPWPTITVAMQEELRVLRFREEAGPAAEALAIAVHSEFERLLLRTD